MRQNRQNRQIKHTYKFQPQVVICLINVSAASQVLLDWRHSKHHAKDPTEQAVVDLDVQEATMRSLNALLQGFVAEDKQQLQQQKADAKSLRRASHLGQVQGAAVLRRQPTVERVWPELADLHTSQALQAAGWRWGKVRISLW